MQEERAELLGDMVNGHPELGPDVIAELEAILRDPDDHYALEAAIVAVGRAGDPRAAQLLLRFVPVDHPEASDHPVGVGPRTLEPHAVSTVTHEKIHLLKGVLVEQVVDPLTGRHLALCL